MISKKAYLSLRMSCHPTLVSMGRIEKNPGALAHLVQAAPALMGGDWETVVLHVGGRRYCWQA